jgi:hypothetical protein
MKYHKIYEYKKTSPYFNKNKFVIYLDKKLIFQTCELPNYDELYKNDDWSDWLTEEEFNKLLISLI